MLDRLLRETLTLSEEMCATYGYFFPPPDADEFLCVDADLCELRARR